MRIVGFMVTHHLAEEAVAWIRHAREVFDDFIIFLDENRLTPGTVQRAEHAASRVHRWRAQNWYDLDFGAMARACASDWVFALDHDEELSAAWNRDVLDTIVTTTEFTHFWCPRRWTIPGHRYIDAAPWWPDFQVRLLRNVPGGARFPTQLHEVIRVAGRGGCLPNLAILHHVLWLFSRAEREAKVKLYEQLRQGGDLRHYYLYEDYGPPSQHCPSSERRDRLAQIGTSSLLEPRELGRITIDVAAVPAAAAASQVLFVSAVIHNGTDRPVASFPPNAICIAYHWVDRLTRSVVVFDGERSAVLPAISPGGSAPVTVTVFTPKGAGDYILQITVVQEHVCWVEQLHPDIVREFPVRVVP